MSKTPRTDAAARYIYGPIEFIEASLARQIEADLEQARAEIERLKALVINCAEWNWLDDDCYDSIPENITSAVDLIVQEKLSLKSEKADGK